MSSWRVVLVGEAPARSAGVLPPDMALTGYTGRRIARWAGVSDGRYMGTTERWNLLDEAPVSWPVALAKNRADNLEALTRGRRVILVGTRVAEAFGFHWPPFTWGPPDELGGRLAWIPHPSGRNRYYNDPANVALAEGFLRRALA